MVCTLYVPFTSSTHLKLSGHFSLKPNTESHYDCEKTASSVIKNQLLVSFSGGYVYNSSGPDCFIERGGVSLPSIPGIQIYNFVMNIVSVF